MFTILHGRSSRHPKASTAAASEITDHHDSKFGILQRLPKCDAQTHTEQMTPRDVITGLPQTFRVVYFLKQYLQNAVKGSSIKQGVPVLRCATAWVNLEKIRWAKEASHRGAHADSVHVKCPEEAGSRRHKWKFDFRWGNENVLKLIVMVTQLWID